MRHKSRLKWMEQTALLMGFGSLLGAGLALFLMSFSAQAAEPEVFGTWLTKGGKSHVQIGPCQDEICGKIIWLKEPLDDSGQPKLDKRNQKDALKERPILGLPMLTGFVKGSSQGHFDDGTIYNPEDGNSYSSEMQLLKDGTLKVEGCVLFFCKEQIWTRVE